MPSGSRPLTGSSKSSTAGIPEQGRRDAETLGHAEGEGPRLPPGHVAEPDEVEYLVDPLVGYVAGLGQRQKVVAGLATRVVGLGVQQSAHLPHRGASCWYDTPLIVAVPLSARARPRINRKVVVLPAPFGPRKPVTTPGWTSKLRSSTAVFWPKRFVRLWTSIKQPALSLLNSQRYQ